MQQWNINIDGTDNAVCFTPNIWNGKHKLTVNGAEVPLERKPFQSFTGLDQVIEIAGKECRFVLIGNKADIAVDGTYVGSKKPYMPLKSMPWWVWIFIVANVIIPIASLGGGIPMIIAILGAVSCSRVGISPRVNTAVKVLCCLGITVLAWVAFIAMLHLAALA